FTAGFDGALPENYPKSLSFLQGFDTCDQMTHKESMDWHIKTMPGGGSNEIRVSSKNDEAMSEYVITVCGKPLAGKTTTIATLGKCLEATGMAKMAYEKVKAPGDALGYLMRIETPYVELKFVWFCGSSMDTQSTRQWVLCEGQAVIYIFSTFQIMQPDNY